MKIKKLLYNSLYIFLPFFLILYILFCINILIKDFDYGHKSHNFHPNKNNWLSYKIDLYKFNFKNLFFNKISGKGLERVDIFIPEKTTNKLLSNIPTSTKIYLPSKMLVDSKIKDTMIRYLGDHPVNYMLEKKSLRIKTRKKELIDKKRYFEYRFTQSSPISDFIAFRLANKIGLLVSDVKLVELYINGKSKGIFLEKERLNESFLRRNKIMPVNLYKGEQSRNIENKIGLKDDLFKNSGMWEKLAISNFFNLEDRSDLKLFLNNLKKAENNPDYLNIILENQNKELFAKKMMLEILIQTHVNNDEHNLRIAIDTWSGKIYHIPHDFTYSLENFHEDNLFLDISYSSLNRTLSQSSYLLDKKYELIFENVYNKKIFQELIKELEDLKDQYLISEKRDFGPYQRKFFKGKMIDVIGDDNFNNHFQSLKMREKEILEIYGKKPNGSWEIDQNSFYIKVDQILPLSKFTVKFKDDVPKWVALDFNNNSVLDDEDIFFRKKSKNSFFLDISLFSNRIPILDTSLKPFKYKTFINNTKFKFFVSDNLLPDEIFTYNKYIKEEFKLKKIQNTAFVPKTNNIPIVNLFNKKVKTFSGDVYLNNDLIVKEEVIIQKGTTFHLSDGASIIFKNKIFANGTPEQPIIFKPKSPNQVWGTVAIHGPDAKNSSLNNIKITGGSGDTINGINYFSSLSIHSTENINFNNINIKDNHVYDDLVHIIYSKNLNFEELKIANAHKDAIDIDVSSNINLKNLNIIDSGNDGVDLMESQVDIENCLINNNKDKGISVGEGSKLNLINCEIKNSNYGIASKDASIAKIKKTEIKNNIIQLSTYKKNWRYNSSGKIYVENSKLISKKNNQLIGDKFGEIKILSSIIEGDIVQKGNIIIKQ